MAFCALLLGGTLATVPADARFDGPSGSPGPRLATVPFLLDHNRMIVELEFPRPDGTVRPARAWVDTGNQYLILAAPLAEELGIDLSGLGEGEHSVEIEAPAPALSLGGLPLLVEGVGVRVQPGPSVLRGVPAEVNLPASALRFDHVVLDYPAAQLTVARPGVLRPRGRSLPCHVHPETGLLRIQATAEGDTLWLGVDNGSAGTWLSTEVTERWLGRHPDWPRASGAAGSANFFGFPFECEGTLLRLPRLGLGEVEVENVGFLALDRGMFDWYSRKSAGPVVGFVGANVLRRFRVEIDFPAGMTYWEEGSPEGPEDLDIVGLTLHPDAGGGVTIVGVVSRDGRPLVEGVDPGDRLIAVDGVDVTTATMGAVVAALRGTPGVDRILTVDREGTRVTVSARVLHLP